MIENGSGSLQAEAEAFAYALDWIISTLSDTTRPIHIYGDATAIGFGADGKQNIARGLNDLGRLVRNLFCLAQSALPEVAYHHVKAHSGQTNNELVDSAAKAIANSSNNGALTLAYLSGHVGQMPPCFNGWWFQIFLCSPLLGEDFPF